MWKRIEEILEGFRREFSYRSAYKWLIVLVIGIMVRTDKLGVTSVIRDLALRPESYESVMRFFRASSWRLSSLQSAWLVIVSRQAPLWRHQGRVVLIGDGTKKSKEGLKMPGVKRLKEESETQSKASYIYGHFWGCVGILIGTAEKLTCLPLLLRLHDGLRETADWDESEETGASHITRLVSEACHCAAPFGSALLLLDRLYPSVEALRVLNAWNAAHSARVDIVSRLKSNAIAWKDAPERKPGRWGRPRKKGEKVKLWELFETKRTEFKKETLKIRGKDAIVEHYSEDLLWGKGLYRKLRVVLVREGESRFILFSTDLSLDPNDILSLYLRRSRIEGCFRELKQQIGAFSYHFWSKSMPRLNRFRKKTDPLPLQSVTSPKDRQRIVKTVRATELYALISAIAMGILQILCMEFDTPALRAQLRYQRTPAGERVSEANLMSYLRQRIFVFMALSPENSLTQLIRSVQRPTESERTPNVA